MKTHIIEDFRLSDIPRGLVGIFGGAIVLMIAGGVWVYKTWKWVTL